MSKKRQKREKRYTMEEAHKYVLRKAKKMGIPITKSRDPWAGARGYWATAPEWDYSDPWQRELARHETTFVAKSSGIHPGLTSLQYSNDPKDRELFWSQYFGKETV
jgi:hypothetical protein